MNKARITYRFEPNADRIHIKEGNQERGQIIHLDQDEFKSKTTLNQFTSDFEWSSPLDIETMKLEKLIRQSGEPKPEIHINPIHPLPPYDTDQNGEIEQRTKFVEHLPLYDPMEERETQYAKASRTPWFKIILSITGAVITGVFFGFLVLTLFSGQSGTPSVEEGSLKKVVSSSNNAQPTDLQGGVPVNNKPALPVSTAAPGIASSASVEADIPAQSFYILQNGVFETTEGAKSAIAKLKDLGFATQTVISDKYYVYAGISTTKNDAELLGHQLTSSGVEIFIKLYEVPAVSLAKWNSTEKAAVQSYFDYGSKLVQMISNESLRHLEEVNLSTTEDSVKQTIKKNHQAWTGILAAADAGMPEEGKNLLLKMNSAMNTAVMSLDEYSKTATQGHLWQVQSSLIEFVTTEKQLLTILSAQL